MAKVVQVPMDGDMIAALDALAVQRGQARAVVIRAACHEYLRSQRDRQLDDSYEEGYRRLPEAAAVGEAQAILAGEVLPAETWYMRRGRCAPLPPEATQRCVFVLGHVDLEHGGHPVIEVVA